MIPKAGQTVTLEEMVDYPRGEVADYTLPEALDIVEELPAAPTGRLQRHVLIRQFQERGAARGTAG